MLTLENALSPGATDIHLSLFASQHRQVSAVRDVNESGNAEELKGEGGVCQSARCVGVLLRLMHIHIAIFGNREQLSHGFTRKLSALTVTLPH